MFFVGVDWAVEHHDAAVLSATGEVLRQIQVPHTAEGFESLRRVVAELGVPAGEIAVAVEMHEGPLVLWFLDQGYQVYGINPFTAKGACESRSPSGAKDDARDARALADHVRMKLAELRPLRAQEPMTLMMRQYVRLREDLVQERTAHKQRLGAYLQQYAPESYKLLSPFTTRWTLELLLAYPTMKRLHAAKPAELRRFARKHKIGDATQDELLGLKDTLRIPVPDCLDAPHAFEVEHEARTIQDLDRSIAEIRRKLAELIRNHPDVNLIKSLPAGGAATRGAIWSGLEHDVSMCEDADELAARWGAAPVTVKSGKSRFGVRLRRACDHTQRQYMLWFSWTTSKMSSCWAHEYYQRKRSEGSGHYEALRCIARRWIRILWCLFTRRTKYDEAAVRRPAHAPSPA